MEALVVSRTWFDKFWTHEDICPRLKYLLEDFDEVRQEFLDNKDKLVWNSWNYGLKRYQRTGYTKHTRVGLLQVYLQRNIQLLTGVT